MNRNVEAHFSELPKVEIQRSIFDRSCSHKTAFNVSELIPFYVDEVVPGDTFNVTTSCVVRLQTPLTPIMDNIYMDTYYFFVPNRLVWEHWKNFMGETAQAWRPNTEYNIPTITPPDGGWNVGTIADYLGIPPKVSGANYWKKPSALPFRAYALICSQWFRDINLSGDLLIPFGDANTQGVNTSVLGDVEEVAKGGRPFKVSKFHDYFTSCLPAPQRGPNVSLLNNYTDAAAIISGNPSKVYAPVVPRTTKVFNSYSDVGIGVSVIQNGVSGEKGLRSANADPAYLVASNDSANGVATVFNNLWADLSQANLSINDLRIAFQLQKFYEKSARGGNRYRELIKEFFGVTTSDARMQIPEYLGGHRFPLSIHQVANQSQGENDFLGDLGAMSNTSDVHEDFVKSFEEHGYVIGVACVRYDHSYPQGLERFWFRKTKTDFYFPVFANIGEQPVYKSEIYWQPESEGVFGYQEAWADYRYKPSRVSGEMRPGVDNSLATWHLADYYQSAPSLSNSWIREDINNVDRVLSVSHEVASQVFCDFYIKNICTRPMPMYSIPGLIDHH